MTWTTFETSSATAGWQKGTGDRLAVVLHGGPGLTDYTEGLAEEVLAGGDGTLRVVRYQQRGQAPSTTEGPLTIAQLAEDLVGVIDHFGADSAIVVGHSWGGHLALHAAVAAPRRVSGLLVVDALGAVGPDGGLAGMQEMLRSRVGQKSLDEHAALDTADLTEADRGIAQLALLWPGYFADPEAAPPMPPMGMDPAVGGALFGDAFRLFAEGHLEAKLPTIVMPSLHLVGRHSPIDPAANQATAALMAGSMVEVLDTGHFIWIEQPGSVESATRRLVAQIH